MAPFSQSETGEKRKSIFTQLTKVARHTLPYRLAKNEQSYCLAIPRCTTIICGTRRLRKSDSPSVQVQTLESLWNCDCSSFDLCEFDNAFAGSVLWTGCLSAKPAPDRIRYTRLRCTKVRMEQPSEAFASYSLNSHLFCTLPQNALFVDNIVLDKRYAL